MATQFTGERAVTLTPSGQPLVLTVSATQLAKLNGKKIMQAIQRDDGRWDVFLSASVGESAQLPPAATDQA